jgi:hypothetical protein
MDLFKTSFAESSLIGWRNASMVAKLNFASDHFNGIIYSVTQGKIIIKHTAARLSKTRI